MYNDPNMIRLDIRLLFMVALGATGGANAQRKVPVGGGGGSAPPPASTDYVDRNADNSYRFGYNTGDEGSHFHVSAATADNSVTGRFGQREAGTGRLVQTTYTAGQRGFRARGDQVARRMDLSQQRIPYTPPVSPDSPNYQPTYSGYHDPNEDPSFEYSFQTPTFTKKESQDSKAEVTGSYTYVDDVGERHNVQYEAGPRTGFHVKTLYPDSTPYTGLFYRGAPANKQTGPLRGKTSIQRGTDGSYRFTATGPDQRRTEVSDAAGNVRGSYTYLDDKGVQRTVQYIAGPNIGYKVIGGSNKGLSPAGSSPGSTGQFPYTPPDIETASPTSSAPPQKDSLNPSANLDEELFGPAPPGPIPSGEPEKQQQEIQGDPEDFLNTPLYGASGSASPQYSPDPSSTVAPSPSPSPSPIPVSQLPQDFDDFLPPLSAFPEDDPSIPKPRPPGGGGGGGSPSYLTLEDNDFLKTPFALLPLGDNYDNSNYGGQFKRPKANNNPSVNNNENPNNNNRNPINNRDRTQNSMGNNNENNNVFRTPPSAPGRDRAGSPGRDRPGYNNFNDNVNSNNNNNFVPSTGRERESYSPPRAPTMRDRDNAPAQGFSPSPNGVNDNFFNTAPGRDRDNGFSNSPPLPAKERDSFPLLNLGGDDDDFLPPLPGANDFPVPPSGGRIDYPPPKDRPNFFEGARDRDRDREPSRRPYPHRDHKYSPSQKTFLGIPSGVAVRAHVQSLDILPFGSRIPPPGQALDYERRRERRRRR